MGHDCLFCDINRNENFTVAPGARNLVVSLLRGGDYISGESLRRIYSLHVVVLPKVAGCISMFHLILAFFHGSSMPPNASERGRPFPFFSNFVFRELLTWLLVLASLMGITALNPVTTGLKADPFASAPQGIRLAWYFLPLYQTLRWLPPLVAGINSEAIVNVMVALTGLVFSGVPFLDRKATTGERSLNLTFSGVIILAYFCVSTVATYLNTH